jgi:hypothetical protein
MNDSTEPFPGELGDFVNREKWTDASTMPKWPHGYLVRERVEEVLFEQLVHHIRSNGYRRRFYDRCFTYYEEDVLYWKMGAPVGETTIANRCKREDSYEYRLKEGILPWRTGAEHLQSLLTGQLHP